MARSAQAEGADRPGSGTSDGNGNLRTAPPDGVLIVMPNWVGDVVLATPCLRALRDQFRDARLALLLKSHLAQILDGGDWADEVIHWPTGKTRPKRRQGFLGLAARLREQSFDWAVLLSNSFKAALLARLAGIRRRIGYDRDGRSLLLTDRLLPERYEGKYLPVSMIKYYGSIARYLGCRELSDQPELFTTPAEEQTADEVIGAAGVGPDQPIVVLNPGASFGTAKRWLPERFGQVADRLIDEHRAAVFVVCGPKETETARRVAAQMRGSATVLADPVLPLGASKALVRRASLLVTNDTGPRHFANAFGTPVVTIFGPTDQRWTVTDAPTERLAQIPVDCGPCMKRHCPLDHRCMTGISSDMVFQLAGDLLVRHATSSTP